MKWYHAQILALQFFTTSEIAATGFLSTITLLISAGLAVTSIYLVFWPRRAFYLIYRLKGD